MEIVMKSHQLSQSPEAAAQENETAAVGNVE